TISSRSDRWPRVCYRFHTAEIRYSPKIGAQYAEHFRHDPARTGKRKQNGRHAIVEYQISRQRCADGHGRDRPRSGDSIDAVGTLWQCTQGYRKLSILKILKTTHVANHTFDIFICILWFTTGRILFHIP